MRRYSKASDVIEANALLFVHAPGNPVPLLSIAGASVAIYIPCNMDPQPNDILMMIAEREPFTVATPIASLGRAAQVDPFTPMLKARLELSA